MDETERRHNRGIDWLVKRLLKKNYDAILMNPIYRVGKNCGELDVLAIRGDYCHYYEVKNSSNYSSRKKAQKQIGRVKEVFPEFNVRGIYVPMGGPPKRM
jgi:Holliday junction resolvase-like predicted endonuclease